MFGTALAFVASVGAPSAQASGKPAVTRGAAYQRLNPKPNLHVMPTHPAPAASTPSNKAVMAAGINLAYWGGPVMQSGTQTIPIFWQPATLQDGTPSAPDAGYNTLLQRFLTDIGGHGLYNNLTQYYQVVSAHTQYIVNSSGFLQAVVDTSPYPASTGDCVTNAVVNCITDLQLQAEIANVITAGSLPKDYSTAYLVFTDPMEASCAAPDQCFNPENYNSFAYCAYHGEFQLGGQPVIYANMPYVDSEFMSNLLCGAGLSVNGGANQSFDDETSPASHEFMEMITDPNAAGDGWYDNANGEIGDLCVGDAVPVTWGANSYIVQTEYSNAVANCVPGGNNQLSISATSGAAGSSTTVTGSGFVANHPATLSFSDASGTVTALGSTMSNGSGAISQLVSIPAGAPDGLGTIDATGANPGDGASAGFTVSGSGPTTFALTVSKAGSGTGGVTSSPAGIDCGATCQFSFNNGDSVTLTATAGVGSTFTGWSGSGCSGTGTCNVSMTQTRSVTATFGLSYLPDGLLSFRAGVFVGNGIYNMTGAAQTRGVSIARGVTAVFHWRVQNDGALTDQVSLSAHGGSAAFKVNFFSGSTNVTAAVVAGTYTRSLAPGASFSLTVKIRVTTTAAIGAIRAELLTATSVNQPVSDVVLARVTAK